MKTKYLLILQTILILLFNVSAYSSYLPPETIIFTLPNSDYQKWIEITRLVHEEEGMIERIPCDQTSQNWTSLMSLHYMKIEDADKLPPNALEGIVDVIHRVSTQKYPSNKVIWNIIDKNEDNLIYEWILPQSYKNTPAQHEISRAFLTKNGLHRIGIARKNGEMSKEERNYWINLFKECASIISYEKASKTYGFSLTPMMREKNQSMH